MDVPLLAAYSRTSDRRHPPTGKRPRGRQMYSAWSDSGSLSVLPNQLPPSSVTGGRLTPPMSHTTVRVTQHWYTPFRRRIRLFIPFFPETPLCTDPLHHTNNFCSAPWPEVTGVEDW